MPFTSEYTCNDVDKSDSSIDNPYINPSGVTNTYVYSSHGAGISLPDASIYLSGNDTATVDTSPKPSSIVLNTFLCSTEKHSSSCRGLKKNSRSLWFAAISQMTEDWNHPFPCFQADCLRFQSGGDCSDENEEDCADDDEKPLLQFRMLERFFFVVFHDTYSFSWIGNCQ